jgi:hypothetical protein
MFRLVLARRRLYIFYGKGNENHELDTAIIRELYQQLRR